jgi:hypothetical protein
MWPTYANVKGDFGRDRHAQGNLLMGIGVGEAADVDSIFSGEIQSSL